MSSAVLASSRARVQPAHPDRVRIAALSAAITINLTVFLGATRPLPPMALPYLAPTAPITARIVPPPAQPLPPPPPLAVRPLPRQSPTTPVAHPIQVRAPASDEGRVATPPIEVPSLARPAVDTATIAPSAAPVEATLAYRSAPLHFPAQAIRQHMHGTVLLRVLVDEQGKPVDVIVEQSSGHALLDRSAREQVLAGWRFQPATFDGRPVRAWARVPVSFELRKL